MAEKPYILIRADTPEKCKVAIHDMICYTHIKFDGGPRQIDGTNADKLLVSVMGDKQLGASCECAAIVRVKTVAGYTIQQIRKIHPPAHIVVISNRSSDAFQSVGSIYEKLDRFEYMSIFSPKQRALMEDMILSYS